MLRLSEIVLIALLVVPVVWALTDALRIPDETWDRSNQNQIVWVVVILLAPLLGPVLYFLIARPRLRVS